MDIEIEVEKKETQPTTLLSLTKTKTGYQLELVEDIIKFVAKKLK